MCWSGGVAVPLLSASGSSQKKGGSEREAARSRESGAREQDKEPGYGFRS